MFIEDMCENVQHIRLTSLLDDEFVLDKVERAKYPEKKELSTIDSPKLAMLTLTKRKT
jgi:hypothetical protein